jgi:hypothetical protein
VASVPVSARSTGNVLNSPSSRRSECFRFSDGDDTCRDLPHGWCSHSFYIEDERVSARSDKEIADFRALKEMKVGYHLVVF